MSILFFILPSIIFVFALSNIVYPLFYAYPKAKKLERSGKLIKPIPLKTFFIPSFIWLFILLLSYIVTKNYFIEYQSHVIASFVIAFIYVIFQIPKKNKDLEDDFIKSWKTYLK